MTEFSDIELDSFMEGTMTKISETHCRCRSADGREVILTFAQWTALITRAMNQRD